MGKIFEYSNIYSNTVTVLNPVDILYPTSVDVFIVMTWIMSKLDYRYRNISEVLDLASYHMLFIIWFIDSTKLYLSASNKLAKFELLAFQKISKIYFFYYRTSTFWIFFNLSSLSALRHPNFFSQNYKKLIEKTITMFIRIISQQLVKQHKFLTLWFLISLS